MVPLVENKRELFTGKSSSSNSDTAIGEEIIHINPKAGSDINGCSLNPNIGCKTISYSITDLKTSRGISSTNSIILKLQSSIDSNELANQQNCRGFDFSGISFSQLLITSQDVTSTVTVNCFSVVSEWISPTNFNLTLNSIKWSNFKIPKVFKMNSISIEACEVQNMTISATNSVNIHNCRVTSDGRYFSTLQLTDIPSIRVSNTSFEKMTVGYIMSLSFSNSFMDSITVENSVLIFYGHVGISDPTSFHNSVTVVNSKFTQSSVRIIEFDTITLRNNTHLMNIQQRYIPSGGAISKYFNEYSYASVSVTCIQTRSDMEARNITIKNMETYGGMVIEGPGLYARIYDSNFQNNRNSIGGGAVHIRTVFRVLLQNVEFISNSVINSPTGKIGLDYIGGGAIYQYRSVLLTKKCYFYDNSGSVFGGGIFSFLPLEYYSFQDLFVSNRASYGGAYASMDTISTSQLYFSETTMTSNNANSSGGAIFTMQSEISLKYAFNSSALISNNSANLLGGGIFFIASKPILNFRGLDRIFIDNYSKASPSLSDYSSFATTISTTPSDLRVQPGVSQDVDFNFMDMFDNEVPYTTNLEISLSSEDRVYSEMVPPNTDGFNNSFRFISFFTTDAFIMYGTKVSMVIALKNIPFEKSLNFDLKFEECGPVQRLIMNPVKKSSIGTPLYECGPDPVIWGIIISISIILVTCVCVTCITFIIWKFYKMRGKIKLLARKEQAEEDLTKKLMDLQTLYNSELENKHSYKDWLIKLEDVELIKKVGEGGGGIVYLANWKRVPVALKTIKLEDEDLDSNDFEHEASLLSSIRHPNIVTFYGVCLSDSAKFMVTEFMHGGSLDAFIYTLKTKKKKISFPQKVQLLSNIASGMSYLHDRCIMHRDLKPGNILLSNDLSAKITDFGLSKLYSTDSGSMTKTCTVGTLLYMAPEVLLGTNYDEKCDVYSFSIIMWQVLFEESSLFNSSYVDDPKYSSIMTETQKLAFKNLNEAYIIVPKMVTEGLRLPLPSLPLSDHYIDYWVHADCGERKLNASMKVDYSIALAGIFTLIESCWNADVSQRPSFTRIVDKLVEFEKTLQKILI